MTTPTCRDPGRCASAISACFFHADPERPVFKGKTLLYAEESMLDLVGRAGALRAAGAPSRPGRARRSTTYVDLLDGLLLEGGSDVCPRTYGEEPQRPQWEGDEVRDRYEIELIHAFHDAGKPVLGICRGIQILNVAFGGTLYQDIATQVPGSADHRNWDIYDANRHEIDIAAGSRLADLYPGAGSGHRQQRPPPGGEGRGRRVRGRGGLGERRHRRGRAPAGRARSWPACSGTRSSRPPDDTDQIAAEPVIDDFLAAAALAATGVQVVAS